jgi:hypothetical protein
VVASSADHRRRRARSGVRSDDGDPLRFLEPRYYDTDNAVHSHHGSTDHGTCGDRPSDIGSRFSHHQPARVNPRRLCTFNRIDAGLCRWRHCRCRTRRRWNQGDPFSGLGCREGEHHAGSSELLDHRCDLAAVVWHIQRVLCLDQQRGRRALRRASHCGAAVQRHLDSELASTWTSQSRKLAGSSSLRADTRPRSRSRSRSRYQT